MRFLTQQEDKPILAVVGFNLLTLFVFITAPVDWKTDNLPELVAFVLLCQTLVFFGFRLGRRTKFTRPANYLPPFHRGAALITGLFGIYLLTFPISYAYRLGFSPLDLSGMANRLMAGVQDPHFGYTTALGTGGSGPIAWTVYFAVSICNQMFFTAGFLYWSRLKPLMKVIFLLLLGIDLFYWVGVAMSFGMASLATTFGLSTMFWSVRAGRRRMRTAGKVALLCLLLGGTIAFFSYNLYRRGNLAEIKIEEFEVARSPINPSHPALAIVPKPLWPTYVMVVSYLGQGYYHTCLAFDLDFRPTGFLGNNTALVSLATLFGIDVWNDTYMHRLQRLGVDEYGVWHSAYTWFASDVSFYGVPPLLFVLAFLFGVSWTQGRQGDFLSRVVFIMLGNILVFLFANNTYLSSVFYSFMVFAPLWLLTRFFGIVLRAPVPLPADAREVAGS